MHCRLIVWRLRPLSNRRSSSSVAETTAGTTPAGTVRASTGAAMPCAAASDGAAEQAGAGGITARYVLTLGAPVALQCALAALADAQAVGTAEAAPVEVTVAAAMVVGTITGNIRRETWRLGQAPGLFVWVRPSLQRESIPIP
jgi:hypothetical protein